MSKETNANIEEETIVAMLMMRATALGEKDAKGALFYETDDSVEFSLAPPLVYHGNDEAGLQAYLREAIHPSLNVRAIAVDEIPRSASGKFEDFLSLVPRHRS